MKAKRNLNASIPKETRLAVYRRDGFRCALCDDTRGLQIHHAVHRSCGGSNDPMNLICLCWRCHAEAHGTYLPERHPDAPKNPEELYLFRRELVEEYDMMVVEYLSDYYACEGKIWYPYGGE